MAGTRKTPDRRKQGRRPGADSALGGTASCTCFNLRKAARAVTQYYDSVMQESGLTVTQFSILGVIHGGGPQPIGALAERMGTDRTTLTRNLKPLERQGLVRIAAGEDRRARIAHLTEHGGRALAEALPLWRRAQATMVERLGEAGWSALLDRLDDAVAAAHR